MPALKVHVRPPHKHKGLMILCAFHGLICGVCYFLVNEYALVPLCERMMPILPGIFAFYALPAVVLTSLLLPPVLCALYFARACQHHKYAYFGGQIMGCCYAAAMFVTACLHEGSPLVGIPWWGYLVMVGVDLGAGAIAGLLNVLFSAVHHNFGSTLLEQDGTLCSSCGYCVAHSSSDHCSECGEPKSTPTRPLGRIYRMSELVGGQSRRLLCGLILCIVLGSGAFVWHQFPAWRFTLQFKTEESVVQQSYHNPAGGSPEYYLNAVDIGSPIEGDLQGRVLVIQQYRRSTFASPLLQVRIGQVVSVPLGGKRTHQYLQDGIPRVVCELDTGQTAQAMDNGLPETLAQALINAADETGWVPFVPGAAAKPDVIVSAEGHFPKLEKGEQ